MLKAAILGPIAIGSALCNYFHIVSRPYPGEYMLPILFGACGLYWRIALRTKWYGSFGLDFYR